MNKLLCDPDIVRVRKGLHVVYHHPYLPAEEALELIAQSGDPLKAPGKSRVYRVGEWAVKSSAAPQPLDLIRHTFMRPRYRNGWIAAHHLYRHGVLVPRPAAFVETDLLGVIAANCMISAFLQGHRNVEVYMRSMIDLGAGSDSISAFLENLAAAINRISASGAYHSDLSGKNILTPDGADFVFLDLDAVQLNKDYTDDLRMKNHVQLYDSFCDMLSDTFLTPFIGHLLTEQQDLRVWMPKVRKGQQERRLKQVQIWAKQGKT